MLHVSVKNTTIFHERGTSSGVVVKALCYKPEGLGFEAL
jgi:hypothetical protein